MKFILSVGFLGMVLLAGASVTTYAQNHNRGFRPQIRIQPRQVIPVWGIDRRYQRPSNNIYHLTNPCTNSGYYNNYPNYGYNCNYNNGYSSNGYNNNRYSRPHKDSRNAFRRGFHHLLGGH